MEGVLSSVLSFDGKKNSKLGWLALTTPGCIVAKNLIVWNS